MTSANRYEYGFYWHDIVVIEIGMARHLFFMVLFCVVCFASCSDRIPDGVVSKSAMPSLLVDVHLADGYIANLPLDSIRKNLPVYYAAIFAKHNIDSTVFRRSLDYYTSRPKIMDEIYVQVEARLNQMNDVEQAMITAKYEEQRRADSLVYARRQDSIYRVQRDSIALRRIRNIYFVYEADTTLDKPEPVTHEKLAERMFEEIRLEEIFRRYGSLHTTDSLMTIERFVPQDTLKDLTPPDMIQHPGRPGSRVQSQPRPIASPTTERFQRQ